jgi:hypothetical protein
VRRVGHTEVICSLGRKSVIGTMAALLIAYAGPSEAGEWEILYMADTGGSRLWVTDDPAEATQIIARVVSPDFVVLLTSCRVATSGMSYLSIGEKGAADGPQFMDESSTVSFRVDDNQPYAVSAPEYFQSAFYVAVPDGLLREMAFGTRVVMDYGAESHQRKIFTLRGSRRALNAVDCNPLE